jgi:hypothetical protein
VTAAMPAGPPAVAGSIQALATRTRTRFQRLLRLKECEPAIHAGSDSNTDRVHRLRSHFSAQRTQFLVRRRRIHSTGRIQSGGPGLRITPSCSIVARSSRTAQCSANFPFSTPVPMARAR